jgi:hypothetical protein
MVVEVRKARSRAVGFRGALGGLAVACMTGSALAEPLPPARPFPALPLPPEVPPPSGFVPPASGARKLYLPLIESEARFQGIPPEVADAVARVESNYDPTAMGGDGERGIMQVMPPTAAMLGFRGTPLELADPATNIRLGVRYLAGAWRLANGDLCRALMKYRAGHKEERMSTLSVEYCRRAKSHLASLGSPLALGPLPVAQFGSPVTLGRLGPIEGAPAGRVQRVAGRSQRLTPVRTVTTSRRFWAAHTARVRAIEARLPWKRGGIMAGG